jgi:hypothetical protein
MSFCYKRNKNIITDRHHIRQLNTRAVNWQLNPKRIALLYLPNGLKQMVS